MAAADERLSPRQPMRIEALPRLRVPTMKLRANDLSGPLLAFDGVGVGLKHGHADDVLSAGHGIDFFEVHAENYMGDGGPPHYLLGEIRARYSLSIHGVGLSIAPRAASIARISPACGVSLIAIGRGCSPSISRGRPMTGDF
jgi:Protein of unknown function (DUF692)